MPKIGSQNFTGVVISKRLEVQSPRSLQSLTQAFRIDKSLLYSR